MQDFTLTATCKQGNHKANGRCVCWVTKLLCTNDDAFTMIRDYMEWGRMGMTATEQKHFVLSCKVKEKWGMVLRKKK